MLKRWFFPYFKKHKAVLALDLFFALLTTGNEIVLPMIIRKITEIATEDITQLTLSLIVKMALFYLVLKAVDVFAGYFMMFGILAWLYTGSVWGFIPDWFPDIFELWNMVERFSHTIDKLQREVNEKK